MAELSTKSLHLVISESQDGKLSTFDFDCLRIVLMGFIYIKFVFVWYKVLTFMFGVSVRIFMLVDYGYKGRMCITVAVNSSSALEQCFQRAIKMYTVVSVRSGVAEA